MQILDPSGHPMMSDEEMGIINRLLRENDCERCLEWGSGNSTVWFPKENPFIDRWYSVEHNKTYLELLDSKIDDRRVTIDVFPEKDDYVNAPVSFGGKFDFILVDGQWRPECVDTAFEVANTGAVILLHDCLWEKLAGVMDKYANRVKILAKGEKLMPNGFYNHRGLALFEA
jgi:predicted O-methyltransferase YrrM